MRISTLLLGATLSLSTFTAMMAQTYCQPTKSSGVLQLKGFFGW